MQHKVRPSGSHNEMDGVSPQSAPASLPDSVKGKYILAGDASWLGVGGGWTRLVRTFLGTIVLHCQGVWYTWRDTDI